MQSRTGFSRDCESDTAHPADLDGDGRWTEYLHRDHQGSLTALTDAQGAVLARYSYDAWGKRRAAVDWTAPEPGVFLSSSEHTPRGYTGHEHLDHVGLIHMNGRVYDPELGRFLSADPFVQFPESTQGLNRYSYVGNNPLSYNDPSGFFLKKLLKAAGVLINFVPGFQGWGGAFLQGFISGFLISGGDFKAGILGGFSAFATFGFNDAIGAAKSFAHKAGLITLKGSVGGLLSEAGGGRFGDGFLASVGPNIAEELGGPMKKGLQDLLGEELTARIVNGALNGVIQERNIEGFVRGGISGLVPHDLGMSETWEENPYANALINVAVDGIRGGIIGGKNNIKDEIRYGIYTDAIGHLVGFAWSGGKGPTFTKGVYVYNVDNSGGAIALGNVVTVDPNAGNDILAHEWGHVTTQSALGRNYLPVHIVSMGLGALSNVFTEQNSYSGAFGEHAPLHPYGYECLHSKQRC